MEKIILKKYSTIKLLVFLCLLLIVTGNVFSQNNEEIRTIKVTAAADEEFRTFFNWEREIENRIGFVSDVFTSEVGIKFKVVRFIEWKSDDNTNMMQLLLRDLRRSIEKGESDIVIGFTSQFSNQSHSNYDDYIAGLAYSFQDYMLVRTIRSERWNQYRKFQSLIHEIGHLFGAVHVKGETSIMQNPISSQRILRFDDHNKRILGITKNRDFNRGIESLSEEDVDKLITIYQEMVELNPEEGFPYFYLSMLYSRKKLTNLGEIELRKAVELNKSIAEDYIIPEYRRRIEENPEDALAYTNLAYAYLVNNYVEDAVRYNSAALKLNPYLPESHNTMGLIALKRQKPEEAVEHFQKAVECYPLFADGYYNLGRCFYILGRYREALNTFERCIDLKPEFTDARLFLGLALQKEDRDDEALTAFESAVFADPSLKDAYKYLGDIYSKKMNYQTALENYNKIKNMDPEYPGIYFLIGRTYLKMNMSRQAIYSLKIDLRRRPLHPETHYFLGQAYEKEKLTWIALDEYEQAESLNPGWIEPHERLGDLYYSKNKINKAIIEFTIVKQLDPEKIQARMKLALIYESQGLINLSIEELKEILNLEPNNAYIHFKLGEAYYKIERYDLAGYHAGLAKELGFADQKLLEKLRDMDEDF